MTIQKSKPEVAIVATNKTGKIIYQGKDKGAYLESSGAYMRLPPPKKVGETITYTVTITLIANDAFKVPYAKRLAANTKNQVRQAAWAKKQQEEALLEEEKELVLRRARIMNQVELAFVKKGKEAMQFITCDQCDAPATILALTHLNPGSSIIDPEQITGAVCSDHDHAVWKPFKTHGRSECSRLEFFYDGLRQIYINKPTAKEE